MAVLQSCVGALASTTDGGVVSPVLRTCVVALTRMTNRSVVFDVIDLEHRRMRLSFISVRMLKKKRLCVFYRKAKHQSL